MSEEVQPFSDEVQPSCFSVKGRKRRPRASKSNPNPDTNPIPIPIPRSDPSPNSDIMASTKKRIWGVTDPFQFPPCEYHRSLLQTVEPLLNVHTRGDLPDFDKFGVGMMKHETIMAAVRVLINRYPFTSRLFSRALTELNIRPRHIALLENLALLTRPNRHDQASVDLDAYRKRSFTVSRLPSARKAEDDISGLQLKGGGEKVTRVNVSSNEGLDVDHEAMPEGEDDRKGRGRADFRAFVWDKGPLKRMELPDFVKHSLDLKRLAVVFESKLNEEIDACSQAAAYSRLGILKNLQNWHVKPIYLIILAATRWTYAILDVHGAIMVKDNTFTEADFEAFKKQEKARWGNKDPVGITSEELKARLEVGLANFRRRYRSKPGASFPTQQYLVGNYYECEKWFSLPVIGVEKGLCMDGCCQLYEGLLRVIVGERVLQWTPLDVQNACDIQLDLHEELNEIEGLEPTLEELEHIADRAMKRAQKKRQRLGAVEDLE